MMNRPPFRPSPGFRCLAVAALLVLGVCQGCGTGAYRERMNKRLAELRQGTGNTGLLYAASQVPGTPLWIRVPQAFTQGFVPGGPGDARRIQPPVTVPGLKATWEAHVTHEGSKLPYYCYLAVSDSDPTGPIQNQLRQLYTGLNVQWSDFTAGGKTWKRFRGDAEQDWIPLDSAGKEMPRRDLPGMLEFDCRQEGSHWMTVGWRVPDSIEGDAKLDRAIGPTLGSLELRGK
jgi:hypothetical protein